jgi:hypothetical protein
MLGIRYRKATHRFNAHVLHAVGAHQHESAKRVVFERKVESPIGGGHAVTHRSYKIVGDCLRSNAHQPTLCNRA